ncbi:MAG: tRNA dihydrouridine(20/20a) synthase DusA [Aquabacterium sp.]|nr:tRNA dihydrouridine(20/20a) synthase DusA [Aquabacterium sp.]
MPAALPHDHSPWRLSVAPMMDWTDRHCRFFHRLITRHTRLYTEMVTTGALLHGDLPRHLDFNPAEHPLALQVGGSEPADLAQAARLARQWGYDEVNINCGCPSERVQRGAFGACLMAEPQLVRDGVAAMRDVLGNDLPVTVKHRIGIDRIERSDFVRDFIGTVAEAGCTVFIVHARNAWLQGLSPKENREIPPLRHALVHQLKRDFPQLTIAINGGITTSDQVAEQLADVDGVMVGRAAYHEPVVMADWDARFWGDGTAPVVDDTWRLGIEDRMLAYIDAQQAAHGTPWAHITRHMLGLWNGQPGARRWRQVWSDHRLKTLPARQVAQRAHAARVDARQPASA